MPVLTPSPTQADLLSQDQMDLAELCRQLSRHVYREFENTELPANVSLVRTVHDEKSGLDAQVFRVKQSGGKSTFVVAYAGTEFNNLRDIISDAKQGAPDFVPSASIERQYDRARSLAFEVRDLARKEKADVIHTGHSLGGGISQFTGAETGANVIAFNAAALGEKILKSLRPELREMAEQRTLHIVTAGDPVFFHTARLPGAAHLGRAVVLPPPPDLEDVVPRDITFRRPVLPDAVFKDAMARHMAPVNAPVFASDQKIETKTAAESLKPQPQIWWASQSTVPHGWTLQQQVEVLSKMSSNTNRVAVVGSGPEVDWLQREMTRRLGERNVTRIDSVMSASQLRRATADFNPDLVLGVRDYAFEPPEEGERLLIKLDTAQRCSDLLRATAWVGRLVQGSLKDPKLLSDPIMRQRAEDLQRFFGSGLTAPEVKERLKTWEKVAEKMDWGLAAANDLDSFQHGEWTLANSQLIGMVIDSRIDKLMSDLSKQLNTAALPGKGVGLLGASDVFKGMSDQARNGHLTVDAIEHYLDACVRTSWGTVGFLLSGGNIKVAERVGDLGVALAAFGRTATEEPFQQLYQRRLGRDASSRAFPPVGETVRETHPRTSDGQLSQAFDQWQVEQISSAHRGMPLSPFGVWLQNRGMDPRKVSRDMRSSADNLLATAQRLQLAQHPESLRTLTVSDSPPADHGTSRAGSDMEIARRMISSGQQRVVISGPERETETLYRWAVEQLGPNNVRRVTQTVSHYTERRVARDFGADTLLRVEPPRSTLSGWRYRNEVPIIEPAHYRHDPNLISNNRPDRKPPIPEHRPNDDLPGVGGVMLHGTASVGGEKARFVGGDFSLVFNNSRGEVDIRKLRMFVTAAWAVYFGKEGPGISIDPIAPDVDKHLVRYIGLVVNSDLGRVMREADYLMKKWAVGTEHPGIEGFKNVDSLEAKHGSGYLGASRRFWFVPEEVSYRAANGALLFEGGRMRLHTAYVLSDPSLKPGKADQAYADFFSEHYPAIAEKYPVFAELFEYAKLVYLARYLKDEGVPMTAFLLANKDLVLTEDSPGTVNALIKPSEFRNYVNIVGGVDLTPKTEPGRYVIDSEAATALGRVARQGTSGEVPGGAMPEAAQDTSMTRMESAPGRPVALNVDDYRGVAREAQDITVSGRSGEMGRLQTDLAIRLEKQPFLEVIRMYDPEAGPGEFGGGWHILRPFRIQRFGEKMIGFRGARIPERIEVVNLINGTRQVLTFSETQYPIVGYVPSDEQDAGIIGLFLMNDLSYRLLDRIGNELHFAPDGDLKKMQLGDTFSVEYTYGHESLGKEYFSTAPYTLRPDGAKQVEAGSVRIPERMRLTDTAGKTETVFVYEKNNADGLVGYKPLAADKSPFVFLGLTNLGRFVLDHKDNRQVLFDEAGGFIEEKHRVLRSLEHGDYRVDFDYEHQDDAFRIRSARVMKRGLSAAVQTVSYVYKQGRLCRVLLPGAYERNIDTLE
jgi:hypothetical protein